MRDQEDLYGLMEDSFLIQQRIPAHAQRKARELTKRSRFSPSVPKYLEALIDREYDREFGEKK